MLKALLIFVIEDKFLNDNDNNNNNHTNDHYNWISRVFSWSSGMVVKLINNLM